jgi:hypothetical protein
MSVPEFDLDIKAQAKRKLHYVHDQHVSQLVVDTFIVLADAYMNEVEATNLPVRPNDSKDDVRIRISLLRQALKGKLFHLPGGNLLEFQIPPGKPYRLEPADSLNRSVVWAPHTEHPGEIVIHTYERLFFRQKTVYIRDTRVNKVEEKSKIAKLMNCSGDDLTPSMHYISSGEMRGAIALQNYFVGDGVKKAVLSADVHPPEKKQNLILLGSPRLDAPDLLSAKHEKYRAFEGGIRPDVHDKHSDQYRRVVHVLMSRRQDARSVHTVFESSHGRATQGVCERLIWPDRTTLCDSIVSKFGSQLRSLPELFQVIFRVELASGTVLAFVNEVEVLKCEGYSAKSTANTG